MSNKLGSAVLQRALKGAAAGCFAGALSGGSESLVEYADGHLSLSSHGTLGGTYTGGIFLGAFTGGFIGFVIGAIAGAIAARFTSLNHRLLATILTVQIGFFVTVVCGLGSETIPGIVGPTITSAMAGFVAARWS